ncbi:MAG TPA: hypothetical protein VGL42_00765 [Opitutaceae bacterium]|jgi:hypothetical protein
MSWFISTDPASIDLDTVHRLLQGSYWAENRSKEIVRESIAHSLCFGVYARKIGGKSDSHASSPIK